MSKPTFEFGDKKCPKCLTEMEEKGDWTDEYYDYYLYQCPNCKNIEVSRSKRCWED